MLWGSLRDVYNWAITESIHVLFDLLPRDANKQLTERTSNDLRGRMPELDQSCSEDATESNQALYPLSLMQIVVKPPTANDLLCIISNQNSHHFTVPTGKIWGPLSTRLRIKGARSFPSSLQERSLVLAYVS